MVWRGVDQVRVGDGVEKVRSSKGKGWCGEGRSTRGWFGEGQIK